MKTLITYILLITFGFSYAQDWQPVNSNTTEDLNDIFFISEVEGYMVSETGSIFKTEDAGDNWESIYTDSTIKFNYVAAITTNSGETKLMAYGKQGDHSILASTLPNEGFISWDVMNIDYLPLYDYPVNEIKGLQVFENKIYFIDGLDATFKSISPNGAISTLANNVYRFGLSHNNIAYVNVNYDEMVVSNDGGNSFSAIPTYPTQFGSNQSLLSRLKAFDDIIIIHCTYPNYTLFSLDNGANWTSIPDEEHGVNYCEIINENTLFGASVPPNHLNVQHDFQPWEPNFIMPEKIRKIYFYNDNLGFVLGENGMVYKTTNMGGVLASTDIEDVKNNLSIYPNPVTNILSIHTQENINEVRVFDASGKLVLQDNSGETTLRLSSLTNGVYVLKIKTDEQVYTEKFIKK